MAVARTAVGKISPGIMKLVTQGPATSKNNCRPYTKLYKARDFVISWKNVDSTINTTIMQPVPSKYVCFRPINGTMATATKAPGKAIKAYCNTLATALLGVAPVAFSAKEAENNAKP